MCARRCSCQSLAGRPRFRKTTSPTGCGWREPGFGNATRHPQPWPGFPWQTLWSKQKIAENSRALFVSVFAPYETAAGKSAAQALAKSIAIDVAADSASATVKLVPHGSAQELTVDLDIRGKWSVARAGRGDRRRLHVCRCRANLGDGTNLGNLNAKRTDTKYVCVEGGLNPLPCVNIIE